MRLRLDRYGLTEVTKTISFTFLDKDGNKLYVDIDYWRNELGERNTDVVNKSDGITQKEIDKCLNLVAEYTQNDRWEAV